MSRKRHPGHRKDHDPGCDVGAAVPCTCPAWRAEWMRGRPVETCSLCGDYLYDFPHVCT